RSRERHGICVASVVGGTLCRVRRRKSALPVHPGCTRGKPPVRGVQGAMTMPQTSTKSVFELLGLPEVPKSGRKRLVAVAVELFYRNGFGAIGVDKVIETAGVTKTTFYKHFESKDDLMVAAVQQRDEWESAAWGRAIYKIAGDDPVRQLTA